MRILTYNIRGGLGIDGRRDTARIGAFVRTLAPDIACFQEVHQRLPWSGWINQPAVLAKALGMRFVFQACVRLPWGGYGLGIATRLPIDAVQRHALPSRGERRGALRVQVAGPQGPTSIFCTHFGLSVGERAEQAACVGEWAAALAHPVVVCGDINDAPSADYVQEMLRVAGLADAGQQDNAPTYPSDAPRARIDVVLHTADLAVQQVSAVPSLLSDHLPLVVDLERA